ncbi:caffeic acid 3-O-methyltransferase 1 isoform X2 [Manihot esculenta]|uniref:O-methyltransferase domain-containing protein n=3 Tax=Manihot esculenta TaxID=3983 RepID=A0A2C9UYK2_MANES|nr:caffeic acid 3-O-methyltransferase 1 isoform X2 [Manihot esculenta]KAG8643097.1 hypothetical protein MANES_11G003300v8 [Manihot esculenta]OAY36202.1 hypothetical protein MANES_11G003300v8 [Manihot esculenta]
MSSSTSLPTSQQDDEAYSFALYLRSAYVFSHALAICLQLKLFDIIAQAGPLTAAEITAHLPTRNPDAPSMIDRLLRLLASYSLLTSSHGLIERRYGLSSTGQFFVRDNKHGVSMAAFPADAKALTEAWFYLKDSILEGGNPFERAHGVPMYKYISSDQESVKDFSKAMDSISSYIISKVLDSYNGFQGLKSLVDVGGGSGVAINMVISKYPSIAGINFDLPHVVKEAPPHLGVKHVGGDMLSGIPSADAIMMKDVLHNWSDEQCTKILKNCYDALPEGGKVIVVSHIMPRALDSSIATKYVCQLDVMMFLFPGGKQRTEEEFKDLAKATGFSRFQLICYVAYDAVGVMEFYK